ncbi:MAG: ABC transporter permease [Chloroflexi bacterium]|nr:ABC transporter permease [Chloroflexota bacterium]
MEGLIDIASWLLHPAHWSGPDGIPARAWEHLALSSVALLLALLVAVPLGLLIGHTRRGDLLAINLANLARAVPSYAVMVMALPLTLSLDPRNGLTIYPIAIAMVLLAIVPILVNAYTGVRDVDRELVEAARAMGCTESQVLRQVELPLAIPVIVGGIRTAAVQVVATAALGAILGYGGLGRHLIDGIARREYDRLWAGVILIAGLAILTEVLFADVQRRLTSPGLRIARTGAAAEASEPR